MLPARWNPNAAQAQWIITDYDRLQIDDEAEGRVFDPDATTKNSLSEGFRAFVRETEQEDPPDPMPSRNRIDEDDDELRVFTDGSCIHNGTTIARVGAGIWYGADDPRNKALRLPMDMENSNNTAEAIAILEAVHDADPGITLKILTDSQLVMRELTTLLAKHEDEGWLKTENRDVIKTTVEALRRRSGLTILQKVKGHAGVEGNKGADALANEGARKEDPDENHICSRWQLTHSGLKLSKATQKLIYHAIMETKTPPKRRTADTNIEAIREAIHERNETESPTDKRIWTSLKDPAMTKETRSFFWRAIQGTYKIGNYWERIPAYERRGVCPTCGDTETMHHILTDCSASGQDVIWEKVGRLYRVRGLKWRKPSLGEILGCPLLTPEFESGPMTKEGRRMNTIIVTESARVIWKI
ncbi:hypothetical protein H0H92_006467, partial [Tricholoma furcatifolium]